MSVKNNFNFIKNEFSNDEKIIENAFRLELLYKKYKYIIWSVVVIIIAVSLFVGIKNYYINYNSTQNSKILNSLLANPKDEALQNKLKNGSEKLYNLFRLKQALANGNIEELQDISKNASDEFVKYIATYTLASFNRDSTQLSNDKFSIGDFASIQEAYLLINDNKIAQAKEILSKIPDNSPLKGISNTVLHYSISKENAKDNKWLEIYYL